MQGELAMKKILLSGAAAVAFFATAPAFAADMTLKAPAPAVIAPTWTGLYIGANVGYSAGRTSVSSITTFVGPPPVAVLAGTSDLSVTGAVGGFQVGYNWQFNPNWLFGLEGDFDWAGQRGTFTFTDPLVVQTGSVQAKVDWIATIRARFGYITGNSLWYVTGGWADGRRGLNTTYTFGAPALIAGASSVQSTKSGWTVGGGVETKLWNSNWSAKLEYLHVDLGTLTTNTADVIVATPTVLFANTVTSAKFRDEIVRVGVNYKIW